MTTYPTLKVVKGNRSIDLNDRVNFYLRPDFVPPETSQATQIATGSALNVIGGRVVARKPQTRTWTFSVRVLGTTDAEIVTQLRGVKALLALAGDANEPVKIQYKPNSDTPEPLWGQFGALLNYEVLDASITIGPDYMKGARRAKAVVATFNVTIQPYAVGKQQRICTAMGGVIEDTIGTVDGRSRGVIIPEATTNLCTNPVFGNATWNTGWTAGASLIETKNTDGAYLLPFTTVSAKLTSTAAANNTYTQSLTLAAVAHTIWALIRLQDGSTPSSTQMQMYYNGASVTTTFTSAGNGLWYAEGSVTGTAGAATCGVIVKNGYTIFLLAMQAEAKAYRTPLCFGDLLGHAWTGTAHASTSTRTAAAVNLPSTLFNVSEGCIRVAVRWQVANTYPNYMMFFDVRDAGHANVLRAYFNPTGDVLTLLDSANVASTTAQTFSVNDVAILHFVWSAAGLVIYKNGVSVASAGTYTPNVPAAKLYIGSDYASGNQALADWQGFAICDVALTATQVANDAANAAAVVADGARLESIPWLWTKDGDDIVDNCNDSTRDNFCVVGGVDGNAQTPIRLHATPTALEPNGVWLVNNHAQVFVKPDPLFIDYNTNADASCSGNGYGSGAINTTGSNIATSTLSQTDYKYLLAGKDAIVFARVEVSAGTLSLKTRILSGSTVLYESDWITTTAGAVVFQLFKTYPIRALDAQNDAIGIAGNPQIQLLGKASTGTPTVNIDYACVMAGDFVEYLAKHSASSKMVVFENKAICTDSSDLFTENMPTTGRVPLSVYPNEFNILMLQMGYVGGSNTVADTFTISAMYVTPKHDLL